MDDTTFTTKAIAAIVAADEKIVSAEVKAFGAIVATYCDLGTKVRALPGFLDDEGKPVRGMAAKVLEQAPSLAQARLSRAVMIAGRGKDGYDMYRTACKEEGTVPTLTGLMAAYSDSEREESAPLTGTALVDATADKAVKAALKAINGADLNTRQRKAALTQLVKAIQAL